jgi:REP element-mobilizing transposase RayT
MRRPFLRASTPVHVTMRVAGDLGSLRRRDTYLAIREATITAARRERFHIVHASVQGTHVHLIVEAESRMALARGMQGFGISAARHINRVVSARRGERRCGAVFTDRYHAQPLETPQQVRNCVAYVLNNWRRHGEQRTAIARGWKLDPFSSAVSFWAWKELVGSEGTFYDLPRDHRALWVWLPKTWLLRESVATRTISMYDVPGRKRGDHDE